MSNPIKRVFGVVLCGGKSSRMGSNKALLVFKGKPLVEYMSLVLLSLKKPLAVEKVFLSGVVDGYRAVVDVISERGPLGGIYSIMEMLVCGESSTVSGQDDKSLAENNTRDYLLIVPVDMPGLSSVVLAELFRCLNDHCQIVHFVNAPLPAVIQVSSLVKKTIYRRLNILSGAQADYSLQGFYGELKLVNRGLVVEAAIDNRDVLVNVNTAEQWNRLTDETSQQ